jgi:hypothetical protein
MQRLGMLVEARRLVYVSVLRPSVPQLHHVCVALLADQVMQLSSLYALAQKSLRRRARMRSGGDSAAAAAAHTVDAADALQRLVAFAIEHLELEQMRLCPIFTRALTLDRLASVTNAYAGPPPPHLTTAARSIARRLGDVSYDEGIRDVSYKEGLVGSEVFRRVVEERVGGGGGGGEGGYEWGEGGKGEGGGCGERVGTMGSRPMCPLLLGSRGRPTAAQDRANRMKWMHMLAQERGGVY